MYSFFSILVLLLVCVLVVLAVLLVVLVLLVILVLLVHLVLLQICLRPRTSPENMVMSPFFVNILITTGLVGGFCFSERPLGP